MDKEHIINILDAIREDSLNFNFVDKLYSSSNNNYFASGEKNYFIKIVSQLKYEQIFKGYSILSKFLDLPDIVSVISSSNKKIIIQNDLGGYLFSSLFSTPEKTDFDKIVNLENKRKALTTNLYKETLKTQTNKTNLQR